MKRLFTFVLLSILFQSIWGIRPFYKFGTYPRSLHVITTDVTKCLLDHEFEVIGIYHPANVDSLCVIVFTCDELTSMATGVADKGALGATMRIGLIEKNGRTSIVMLNPNYFVNAYLNGKANIEEVEFMTSKIDSLACEALSEFSGVPVPYGYDLPKEELKQYRFFPTMPKFTDMIELGEYDEFLDATSSVKFNILKGVSDSELVYELFFEDKEIAVFGVSFNNNNKFENELLAFVGVESLPSLPFEILVQGNKAYMLNPKYRIPLYKPDMSRLKLFKLLGLSSDLKDWMMEICNKE